MGKITKLTCSSCGAKLETTPKSDRYTCAYCGVEYVVSRGIGTVSIHPILSDLEDLELRSEQKATYQAKSSLESEVEEIRREIDRIEVTRTRGPIKAYFYGGLFVCVALLMLCPATSIISLGETGTGIALISLSLILFGTGVYVVARKVAANRNLDRQLSELEQDLAHKVSDLRQQQ